MVSNVHKFIQFLFRRTKSKLTILNVDLQIIKTTYFLKEKTFSFRKGKKIVAY